MNYRERVQRAATAHRIVGSVENDKKDEERVLIDAQGSPKDLSDFMEAIRGPEGRSDAQDVVKSKEVQTDPALNRFLIKRGKARQETLERMEFARHALTDLAGDIELLRGEVGGIEKTLTSLEKDYAQGLGALQVKIDNAVGATEKLQRDVKIRLERLEAASQVFGKSLVRVERAVDVEAQAKVQRARSVEQQRAALLRLVGELERSGPGRPRRQNRRR